MSSTYLPLLSGARPQTPSAQLRTSLLLLHPFIPPLSDPTRVRRVSPWRSWRRSCDPSSGWIPPSVPECHLMTSHEARGGRDSTSGQRHAKASEVHPPTSRLVHAGNDVVGLGSSRPWTFSSLTSYGQSHVTPLVVDVSRVVAIAGRAARTLDPGQRPATFDRWAKDLTCWSPSHPPSYGPSSGPIGLCPPRGRTYALAFFPSTPWTDANDSFPPVGRRLGISHSIWLRCPSVHLIDKCPAAEQVCGAVRVVSRSPYSGQLFPAWGKGVKFCGLVLDRKGLVSSKRPRHDQRHRGTTIRSDECSQHGERRWVQAREPMTGPENQEAACARFAWAQAARWVQDPPTAAG